MAQPTLVPPVKYFIAILQGAKVPARLFNVLEAAWGRIDFQSQQYSFDQTKYYEAEMGPDLQRQVITFAELRSPEELASAKLKCNEIETQLARSDSHRAVNLDIGYLDHNKIVLASAKGLGQKIYLSKGIYADLVARYKHGRYQPFEWTFPDFKDGRYDADLALIRQMYLNQIKASRD